jgi:hypothetical protein
MIDVIGLNAAKCQSIYEELSTANEVAQVVDADANKRNQDHIIFQSFIPDEGLPDSALDARCQNDNIATSTSFLFNSYIKYFYDNSNQHQLKTNSNNETPTNEMKSEQEQSNDHISFNSHSQRLHGDPLQSKNVPDLKDILPSCEVKRDIYSFKKGFKFQNSLNLLSNFDRIRNETIIIRSCLVSFPNAKTSLTELFQRIRDSKFHKTAIDMCRYGLLVKKSVQSLMVSIMICHWMT